MNETRKTAQKLLVGFCRVCPICNGRACAGEVPGMGGLGTGASFMANVMALAQKTFVMRLIHDVVEPQLDTSILGLDLFMPVMAAPIWWDFF